MPRVGARARSGRRHRAPDRFPLPAWTLVYDGDCRVCVRWVAILWRWDRAGSVLTVPFQDGEALDALLPVRLGRADLEAAMHLVSPDCRVFVGAAAAAPLLRLLPGGSLLATLFGVPGIPRLAAVVYQWIARNRHHLSCGSVVCRRGR